MIDSAKRASLLIYGVRGGRSQERVNNKQVHGCHCKFVQNCILARTVGGEWDFESRRGPSGGYKANRR